MAGLQAASGLVSCPPTPDGAYEMKWFYKRQELEVRVIAQHVNKGLTVAPRLGRRERAMVHLACCRRHEGLCTLT